MLLHGAGGSAHANVPLQPSRPARGTARAKPQARGPGLNLAQSALGTLALMRVAKVATRATGTAASTAVPSVLRYFRFHSELPHPVPARRSYVERRPGSGWPEQCPPMQAASAFGWDVINPFEIQFDPGKEGWEIHSSVEVGGGDLEERGDIGAFDQDNCWQWDPNQVLPHRISPQVYPEIRNQAKVSTYLYLQTPPGWAVLMSDVPNLKRRFRILSAMIDTDWYFPAHPWHAVVELPRTATGEPIVLKKGEPLCRLTPVSRGTYAAREMRPEEFKKLYYRGQAWLDENGRPSEDPEAEEGVLDIRGAYARDQRSVDFEARCGILASTTEAMCTA
ncbi:unnamed protein product [Symbiodinium natans]|uniref:Uncharacterized protein n=1 Tax=Symbiodinium natans TaxID=878477 RepID=A0A812U454_9DINO|nr:unnamed protein product [Symbiodinium natans]